MSEGFFWTNAPFLVLASFIAFVFTTLSDLDLDDDCTAVVTCLGLLTAGWTAATTLVETDAALAGPAGTGADKARVVNDNKETRIVESFILSVIVWIEG